MRSIDISKIPDNISRNVIDDLWDRGICGYGGPLDDHSARGAMRNGNHILVKDLDRFQKYRDGVSDVVKWIETNGERFLKRDKSFALQNNEKRESSTIADGHLLQVEEGDEQDDCFSYDGGISAPYAYTDLELFIMKKILLEHRQRDDGGFCAKELSFDHNSLEEICRPINLMIEDKILYLSANTHPERSGDDKDDGIEDKRGFINWKLVKKFDNNPSEIDATGGVNFDTDGLDDLKLKARIDFGVEEFMNDRIQNPFGSAYGMDKAKLNEMLARNEQESDRKKKEWVKETFGSEESFYPYSKQREIIIDELAKNNGNDRVISLNDFRDKQVDVLKTLLALEKENFLRIKELKSNEMYDEGGNFVGLWATKDNPSAKISILKIPAHSATKLSTHLDSGTPFTSEEKGMGYFHLSKHGAKIEIGGVSTRPFRLLRRLCDPFGPSQKVAEVFESIRKPQDDRDSQLREYNPEKISRMVHIIRTSCIKEYQKMSKLKGKIKIRFNPPKTEIWLEILT